MAELDVSAWPLPWTWFASDGPVALGRAPGRLDVMGGIADYSGATVLELPLALGVYAAAQQSGGDTLEVRSDGPAAPRHGLTASIPAGAVLCAEPAQAPERLRAALIEADALWAAYVLGPLAMLRAAGLLPPMKGLRLALWSDVPAGAGLSSSAALEVAALRAVQGLLGLPIEPLALARLAQQAEHRVALAPCGIMDQATAVLGRADELLVLRCQPAQELGHRRLPRRVRVLGIDSRVAHSVAASQYARARVGAFMGRAIIKAQGAGDPPGDYLCNLGLERFTQRYEAALPPEMGGAAFLSSYGATGDDATNVVPETCYRVRSCTAHPIYEQANVEAFLAALDRFERSGRSPDLAEAGEAMYRSHRSYSERCGLGTAETDLLVELVRAEGEASGLYGAKITGGGAGGTVAVLAGAALAETDVAETDVADGVDAAIGRVCTAYEARTGHTPRVVNGSGMGALAIPPRLVRVDEQGRLHDA